MLCASLVPDLAMGTLNPLTGLKNLFDPGYVVMLPGAGLLSLFAFFASPSPSLYGY